MIILEYESTAFGDRLYFCFKSPRLELSYELNSYEMNCLFIAHLYINLVCSEEYILLNVGIWQRRKPRTHELTEEILTKQTTIY